MNPLEKYLKVYATPLTLPVFSETFDRAVAIPCFGETVLHTEETLSALSLASQHAKTHTLVVLVVNQRRNASLLHKEANQRLLEHYKCLSAPYAIRYYPSLTVLILNRTFAALEFTEKEGVGLARKIGCDAIAKLYLEGTIKYPWIYTTDIDARVANDYFYEESLPQNCSLKVYPFRHLSEQEANQALFLYDIWLRYYVLSLKKAFSPYAFSNLGSTFCISIDAYAKVRGFPNRLAAEDFHLASKLSKIGSIVYSSLSPITLIARDSDRVPFGTGVGTRKYEKQIDELNEITFLNPKCFDLLSTFLSEAETFFTSTQASLPNLPKEIDEKLGLRSLMQIAYDSRRSNKDRLLHFHSTFDALKTLRFIHLARDFYYPNLPFNEALRELDTDWSTSLLTFNEISSRMAVKEEKESKGISYGALSRLAFGLVNGKCDQKLGTSPYNTIHTDRTVVLLDKPISYT